MSALDLMPRTSFDHEALFYSGEDEFVAGTVPFIREGLAEGEAVLVAVSPERMKLLESELDGDASTVEFMNMAELGRNPARIISAWRDFVGENTAHGRRVRGIGEPAWPGRTADEMVECSHHESLLNLAFTNSPAWRLLCPYDAENLEPDVLEGARRNHPHVVEDGARVRSEDYLSPARALRTLEGALPEPTTETAAIDVGAGRLREAREHVTERAEAAGLASERVSDLALAVTELVTNSVRHSGGDATLRVWREPGEIVCEVRDRGRIFDPLVGRQRPSPTQRRGRGLWIVNQLCDLVQIRSLPEGSVVRLRMQLADA